MPVNLVLRLERNISTANFTTERNTFRKVLHNPMNSRLLKNEKRKRGFRNKSPENTHHLLIEPSFFVIYLARPWTISFLVG